jgi:hypothetical protein
LLLDALSAGAKAGVAVRIAFDPTSANVADAGAVPATLGASPKPPAAPSFLNRLQAIVDIKPISGYRAP